VSILVVDLFELVQVHQRQRQGEAITLHARDLVFQPPQKGAAIRQTGEFIGQTQQPDPGQFIGQLAAVGFDDLQIMMRAVQFVRELVMAGHQFFDFPDQGPAQIFQFRDVADLAQLAQHHLQQNAEFLILGDGVQYLLGQARLQFLDIPPAGVQLLTAIRGYVLVIRLVVISGFILDGLPLQGGLTTQAFERMTLRQRPYPFAGIARGRLGLRHLRGVRLGIDRRRGLAGWLRCGRGAGAAKAGTVCNPGFAGGRSSIPKACSSGRTAWTKTSWLKSFNWAI
jgi:hypothetical protein